MTRVPRSNGGSAKRSSKRSAEHPIDLIHAHGLDFAEHLPQTRRPDADNPAPSGSSSTGRRLSPRDPDAWFHCVSAAQQRRFPPLPNMLDPIPNGVPVDRL